MPTKRILFSLDLDHSKHFIGKMKCKEENLCVCLCLPLEKWVLGRKQQKESHVSHREGGYQVLLIAVKVRGKGNSCKSLYCDNTRNISILKAE